MNKHPEPSRLLSFADAELPHAEAAQVALHLGDCAECREQVRVFRQAGEEYAAIRKSTQPPPPERWADLRPMLRTMSRERRVSRVSLRWLGVAAAVLVAVILIPLLHTPTLNAAELLREAVIAAEKQSERPRRIRVKTARAQFVRPAVRKAARTDSAEEAELSRLFAEARFRWEEPLAPRAFADWRNRLAHKDDRVRVLRGGVWGPGRFYQIATSTPDGSLAEASITIRADDLRAVQQTFRFRSPNEYVEIAEAEDREDPGMRLPASTEQSQAPAPVTDKAPDHAVQKVTPAQELRVIAAIHGLGADLGDPVEVTRDDERGKVVITALGADADRQAQLRTALGSLPYVTLRFEQPEAVRPVPRAPAAEGTDNSNALGERLATTLGSRSTAENFINHVVDLSEAAMARAHALRALARRFPPEVEAGLGADDAALLRKIEEDHTKALAATVRSMNEVIRPVIREAPPAAEVRPFSSWQEGAENVLDSAREVDGMLTAALGNGRASSPEASVEQALARLGHSASELQRSVAALRTVVARNQ